MLSSRQSAAVYDCAAAREPVCYRMLQWYLVGVSPTFVKLGGVALESAEHVVAACFAKGAGFFPALTFSVHVLVCLRSVILQCVRQRPLKFFPCSDLRWYAAVRAGSRTSGCAAGHLRTARMEWC